MPALLSSILLVGKVLVDAHFTYLPLWIYADAQPKPLSVEEHPPIAGFKISEKIKNK